MTQLRKQYWKLPVVDIKKATMPRTVDVAYDRRDIDDPPPDVTILDAPPPLAIIDQAREWVDLVRECYGDMLRVYGRMAKLAEFARLVGYVVVAPDALQTNLPWEALPPGLDRDEFVQAFAGMMQNVILSVPDELTMLMMRNSRGGLA